MNRISFPVRGVVLVAMLVCSTVISGQELKPIQLLSPQMDGGRPLMQPVGYPKQADDLENTP